MHVVLLETTVPRGFHHVATLAAHGVEVSFVTEDLARYRAVPGFEDHRHCTRTIEVPSTRDPLDLSDLLGPHPGGPARSAPRSAVDDPPAPEQGGGPAAPVRGRPRSDPLAPGRPGCRR